MRRQLQQVPDSPGNSITQLPTSRKKPMVSSCSGSPVPVSCGNEIASLFQQQTRNLTELEYVLWASGIVYEPHCFDYARGPIMASPFDLVVVHVCNNCSLVAASCGELTPPCEPHCSRTPVAGKIELKRQEKKKKVEAKEREEAEEK